MRGHELTLARRELGLSVTQLAECLKLELPNGRTMLREMESGKRDITGPIAAAVRLMLLLRRARFFANEARFNGAFTEKGQRRAKELVEEIDNAISNI